MAKTALLKRGGKETKRGNKKGGGTVLKPVQEEPQEEKRLVSEESLETLVKLANEGVPVERRKEFLDKVLLQLYVTNKYPTIEKEYDTDHRSTDKDFIRNNQN